MVLQTPFIELQTVLALKLITQTVLINLKPHTSL